MLQQGGLKHRVALVPFSGNLVGPELSESLKKIKQNSFMKFLEVRSNISPNKRVGFLSPYILKMGVIHVDILTAEEHQVCQLDASSGPPV